MMQVPPGFRPTKSAPCSPAKPVGVSRTRSESFHIAHKVPVGDTPYVRAKHVQLVDKDPEKAIPLFWAAINAGDRVDSALKDMAIVMKQQNRAEEAIEAIKSLRNRCSDQAQESLDNILLDLYKRCGRLDDQISLLRHKLFLIQQGLAFNGKRTKTARSQGKKFQVSVEQEATRLLGNLGWALMQHSNYVEAEDAYRRALSIAPDNNKMCNLGICLMKQGRIQEAKETLRRVKKPAAAEGPRGGVDSHLKAYERAQEMLQDLESNMMMKAAESALENSKIFEAFLGSSSIWQPQPCRDNNNNNNNHSNNNSQLPLPHPHPHPLPGGSNLASALAANTNTNSKILCDVYGDENLNSTNHQLIAAAAHLGHKVVLKPDAPPFYSAKFAQKDSSMILEGGGGGDGSMNETLKRTRSGSHHRLLVGLFQQQEPEKATLEEAIMSAGGVDGSSSKKMVRKFDVDNERRGYSSSNKLRRRSLSFDESMDKLADLLPDDKDFEDAIISVVLTTAESDAAADDIIKFPATSPRWARTTTTGSKDEYWKRLRVFQDITLAMGPRV